MTTTMTFTKAEKRRAKLRLALDGPAGAGKTYTALVTATAIAGAGRVAVIDTERGSASLYADMFDFDVLELHGNYDPARYIQALRAAEQSGDYTAVVIDSLSHAWEAEGGVMEIADRNKNGGNTWSGWAAATPAYRALVDAILQSPLHVIATMRTKTEWTTDERGRPQKVGTAPVMRQGIDYEFSVVADLDVEHVMRVSKSRCPVVADKSYRHPGPEFGRTLVDWLEDGGDPLPPVWMERWATAVDQVGEDSARGLMKGAAPEVLDRDAAWQRLQDLIAAEDARRASAPGSGDADLPDGDDDDPGSTDASPSVTPGGNGPSGEQATTPMVADTDDAGAPPAPASSEPVRDERPISDAQRRHLFALATAAGLTDDESRPIMLHVARVESRRDIQRWAMDPIIEAFAEAGRAKTDAKHAGAVAS